MGRPSRPPYTIEPALAEAIVLDAWLQREIVGRRGVNLVTALAHPSERLALESLASALASLADIDNVRAWIGWARSLLDPPDTEIRIDAQGSEAESIVPSRDIPRSGEESVTVSVVMLAADTLVLFEFLCREIEEGHGANLLAAFVSPAEFWALNNLQCLLEAGDFYSASEDYGQQIEAARALLVASKSP